MMNPNNTDFDFLCEGVSPEEAKRLRKILSEWCNGDEFSFPVQLALLTRAQWRAAARIPPLTRDSCELIKRTIAEFRTNSGTLVDHFGQQLEVQVKNLEHSIKIHTSESKQSVAQIRGHLQAADTTARRIATDLERGAAQWTKAAADFEAQREKLERAWHDLLARLTLRDVFALALFVLTTFGTGIAVGIWIMR